MTGLAKLKSSLAVFVSASRVAAALESHNRPLASDLRRLGIDPKAFTSLGHG